MIDEMKLRTVILRRVAALAGLLIGPAVVPGVAGTLAWAGQASTTQDRSLESAFRTCVGLYGDPLAGALMRTISDPATRKTFEAEHAQIVSSLQIERDHDYATVTAKLRGGISIAGIPVRAMYASTCELDCPLAVWGLELGSLKPEQLRQLKGWVASAPATHTDVHGDIKVQLGTTPEGESLLVCDVSG